MTKTPIQFSRPCFGPQEAEGAAATIASGWVVGGPKLKRLEERFAALCGKKEAVGVSSWTTGGFLVLHSLGFGPGDEVIVPSLTFIASVNVVSQTGAKPVFVDVEPGTWNVDPADVVRKITSRTKAIIAIDQLGMPCRIDDLAQIARARDLHLIQDAACSFASCYRGDPVGARCDIAIFSLHARKVVTTGEGGMIVTDDPDYAARLRCLRHQGMSASDFQRHGGRPTNFETYSEIGFNFRLTDVQAAIGLAQLDRLPQILEGRHHVAWRYREALAENPHVELPRIEEDAEPNWQSFQIRLAECAPLSRNALMDALFDRGIPTRRGVMASHREPPYHDRGAILPITEDAADRCLQLPMHPGLTDAEITLIIEAVQRLLPG